jgi:hypothetical protein
MTKALLLEKIEKQVEELPLADQLEIVEKIIRKMKKEEGTAKKSITWRSLYGLGKDIWQGTDAQEYVASLREDRT